MEREQFKLDLGYRTAKRSFGGGDRSEGDRTTQTAGSASSVLPELGGRG